MGHWNGLTNCSQAFGSSIGYFYDSYPWLAASGV